MFNLSKKSTKKVAFTTLTAITMAMGAVPSVAGATSILPNNYQGIQKTCIPGVAANVRRTTQATTMFSGNNNNTFVRSLASGAHVTLVANMPTVNGRVAVRHQVGNNAPAYGWVNQNHLTTAGC